MKRCAARLRGVAVAVSALGLVACGSVAPISGTPAAQDDAAPLLPRMSSAAGFEQRLRDRALRQGRQGRLAEAALSWEILTVLRPDAADYRERLAETHKLIDTTVPERLQRGAQAMKRGELDAAAVQYLAALALQPDHALAADALRQVERERNKRVYLGKYSRLTLTRRAAAEAQMAAASPAVPLDHNEVEHAAMLGTQGEVDEAIALLERHLAVDKQDAAACRMLADMYFQKAEKHLGRDKAGAILAFEKSLRLDASNTRAAARLKQLRNGAVLSPVAATTVACSLR